MEKKKDTRNKQKTQKRKERKSSELYIFWEGYLRQWIKSASNIAHSVCVQ